MPCLLKYSNSLVTATNYLSKTLITHRYNLNPFKSVKNGAFHSVRVSLGYRALGIPVDQGVQWFWIGSHADYDKLLS